MLCRHESCGNPGVTFRKENTMKRAALALLIAAGIGMASMASASAVYSVDDDRDGRADRWLILEQSDSLA
jgi:hypothetical protein